MATFLGNTANKSLTDLSSLGNAKLQYRPFSINNGAVNEDSTSFYNIEFIGNVTRNYYNGDCIGFSSSDYLTMYPSTALDVSNGETWEMVWEVTTGSDVSTSQYFVGSAGLTNSYDPVIIGLYQGKFYSSVCFSSSSVSALSSTITALANTTYKVKLEFTGTAYNLYVNGELGGTLSSSTPIYTGGRFIIGAQSGSSGTINGPWLGAVNLKNSYINVNGNRWWNGIVKNRPNGTLSTGLTVYGSPTINNGNISNFSADNRANLPHYFDVTNGETWEMVWEVTTGSNTSTSQYFLGTSSNINANDPIVLGLYNGKFGVWLKYNLYAGETIHGTTVAAINTTYTIKAEFTGSAYNLYVNGNLEGTLTSSTPIYLNNLCVGIQAGTDGALVSPWLGSVNVLNSYIKINDEMWWDGSKSFGMICAPCTITTCDGRTLVDSNTIFKVTTSMSDNTYYIFKNYTTGVLQLYHYFTISSVAPTNIRGRWLDTSKVPYTLKEAHDGSFIETDNDYVCIGKCTVTSGRAHNIENYDFNLDSEGDWVYKNGTLTSYVDYPTSTDTVYDLSSYLPDDNCVYEIIIFAVARTGTTAGNTIGVRVTSSILTNYIFLTYAQTRSNAQNRSSNAAIVPIGVDRKLTLPAVSGTVGVYALYLRGYRRLGLNVYSA